MKLSVKYFNDLPDFKYASNSEEVKVFEINPLEGSSQKRREVSVRYIKQIDYAIKGVKNNADEYIKSLKLEVPNLELNVLKDNALFDGGLSGVKTSKYNTIIYDIAPGVISENLYITKGGMIQDNKVNYGRGAQPNYDMREVILKYVNKAIIERTDGNSMSANIVDLIQIVEKYIPKYSLKWNNILGAFQLKENGKKTISYDQIKADDAFTFFRLLGLVLDKGKHNGVFYIRAESYRTDILKAILEVIDYLYEDKYLVFLYNADLTSKGIAREVINIPNYLVMKGE